MKVILAGALEATTSFASWAISHLARNTLAQEKVFQIVKDIDDYTPENLDEATYLRHVLDESLLTPSLYFLPRRATSDIWVETADGRRMFIPNGTHILLDVWHANRHEDHWGIDVTGYPALDFVPERWAELAAHGRGSRDSLHFGFGNGPRVCPGKHLGQLEVGLVVGAFVKLFKFRAVNLDNPAKAGVSTKPSDGTLVELELRQQELLSVHLLMGNDPFGLSHQQSRSSRNRRSASCDPALLSLVTPSDFFYACHFEASAWQQRSITTVLARIKTSSSSSAMSTP